MRLVTFLGTGKYKPTRYAHPDGRAIQTTYVAHAIARLWEVTEIVALATEEAEEAHGAGLIAALEDRPRPQLRRIPSGRSESELWQQFEALRESLEQGSSLILDITHGFRSQPFFAAGALTYLRMIGALHDREVSVLYGRFLPDDPEESPIWDLTPFVDLLDWAHGAALMVETGHAGPLLDVARRSDKDLRRRLAAEGRKDFPPTNRLIKAIEELTDDLATVRVAALITGYAQGTRDKEKVSGSAKRLLDILDEYGPQVAGPLPALEPVLGKIRHVAQGLSAPSLGGAEGRAAMRQLAHRYLDYARYPEAAIVLREALVSLQASDADAVEVNSPDFDPEARKRAEEIWSKVSDSARDIADVRNDIEHGGFRKQPKPAVSLKRMLRTLIEQHLDGPADKS